MFSYSKRAKSNELNDIKNQCHNNDITPSRSQAFIDEKSKKYHDALKDGNNKSSKSLKSKLNRNIEPKNQSQSVRIRIRIRKHKKKRKKQRIDGSYSIKMHSLASIHMNLDLKSVDQL